MAMREVIEESGGEILRPGRRTEDTFVLTALRIGLKVLSERALVWCAAILAGVLWTWTVVHPSWIGYAVVAGYTLTVLLPVLIIDAYGGH